MIQIKGDKIGEKKTASSENADDGNFNDLYKVLEDNNIPLH